MGDDDASLSHSLIDGVKQKKLFTASRRNVIHSRKLDCSCGKQYPAPIDKTFQPNAGPGLFPPSTSQRSLKVKISNLRNVETSPNQSNENFVDYDLQVNHVLAQRFKQRRTRGIYHSTSSLWRQEVCHTSQHSSRYL